LRKELFFSHSSLHLSVLFGVSRYFFYPVGRLGKSGWRVEANGENKMKRIPAHIPIMSKENLVSRIKEDVPESLALCIREDLNNEVWKNVLYAAYLIGRNERESAERK
jgi:hypothetical protein